MISRFFFEDHREIDALFNRLRRELGESQGAPESDSTLLAESFQTLDERLERHIRREEEVLFPAVEGKAPDLAHGPGSVLRSEHQQIRSYMSEIRDAFGVSELDDGVRQGIQDALRAVESLLGEHNEKEETVYYPLCDSLLTEEEAALVLDQVREGQ